MFLICLFDNLPEDDLKQIETRRSVSGLYVKVYNLILVHLLLTIKLFINTWI
jgi:hypothetical protein